jgi:histidyl-tRNA synthetase
MGIKVVIVLGPDEVNAGKVTLKNLSTHTQELVDSADAAASVREFLAEGEGL